MGVLFFKGLECGDVKMADVRVPLAKRGEPKGGGQFINSERAIGIRVYSHTGS
jgi:hypothetical protein